MNKILLIGTLPPPFHGSSIYFQNLLNSKIREEFKTIHLDISDHRNLDNLGRLDFTNVRLALKNSIELTWLLLIVKPNIVYIPISDRILPYIRDGLFILIAHYLSKTKIIIHMHVGTYFRNAFYEKSNFILRFFIRWTMNKVDTAIVLGESLKKTLHGLVKRIVAVPNGTNFNPLELNKQKSNKEKIIVSYLGNLFKSKGILNIIKAAKIVLNKHQNVKFRFAGSWWDHEPETKLEAFKLINQYKLHNYIDFVGVVFKKEKFLLETDIFVFPSWRESFGLVNIEAMAASCPVISTKDVGAIPEIVVDGVTGLLVERQNSRQLAEAIIKLIKNPKMREQMGQAGRERFEKYYTMKKNVDRMIEVFNDVFSKK